MMLAGLPVPHDAVDELAVLVRAACAEDLADPLERALADCVKLISSQPIRRRRYAKCDRRARRAYASYAGATSAVRPWGEFKERKR